MESTMSVALAPTVTPRPSLAGDLLARIEARTATVAILGLGYVGLPLAETFAWGNYPVLGFDIDPDKIARLKKGESYIGHICPERVAELNASGRFDATTDPARLKEADVLVICVPTPLGEAREPDLSYVVGTAQTIRNHLRPGQLIVLESSTYPGTTDDLVRPILEETGLVAGRDFFLAYSPEREDPGNKDFATRNIPKVVGGIDTASRDLALALYRPVVDGVVSVSSARVAEACKILENTYRAVNIALANELKTVFEAMGIDVWEVIEAAKTKPFGFQAFYPGPGLGGHCIPIDPFYLTWAARRQGVNTRFIELAGEINTAMPLKVVERVSTALNEMGRPVRGSRVCILGVAYKKDVDDPRESPAFPIIEGLQKRGAVVSYNDPHVAALPRMRHHPGLNLESQELTAEFLAAQDCLVVVTDHSAYDFAWIAQNTSLIVDTRNVTAALPVGECCIYKA
jgi:UDP-N-acetyl-D-glucosamine dehydrogenase